jgi:DNA-binding MarR family transcriptional regulator
VREVSNLGGAVPQDRDAEVARIQLAMSVVVRNVRNQALGRYVASRGGVSYGDIYYGLLPYVHRSQPVRISDLAEMVQLEIPTVSRHLAVLGQQGIIAREPHPVDGRSILVSLTPKGEAIFDATFQSWLVTIDEVAAGLNDDELEDFSNYLSDFAHSLGLFVDQLSERSANASDESTVSGKPNAGT